ncbi:unnamed protein product [Eruca vesicaria subsp. sativa]|uniref:C2 NT-type domain-containing protein n=1 Tax=Eruca vesicaria subsp. sativa TaxID=29727 RepID=A0ABC8KCT9_ERUVS|nr:unnamed protein product [Eruca vesicaria subsp. sativa]
MVVKMMKWRPWPPLVTRKYEVKLTVRRLEGLDLMSSAAEKERLTVEIRWKGPKATLGSLRRSSVKRDFTKEAAVAGESDVVSWGEEEFQSLCSLTSYKEDTLFYPWEIAFSVFTNGMKQGQKNKAPLVGTASLNLAEYARVTDQREFELKIPLTLSACIASEPHPLLCVSLSLLELRTTPETSDSQTAVVPVPSPPPETHQTEKEDVSAIKAGLRKVKIFVSTRKAKKACHREEEEEAEEGGRFSSFESSESLDLSEEASDECKEDLMSVRKSFSYGPLSYANGVGSSLNRCTEVREEDEDWVYYSHRKSDVGGGGGCCSDVEEASSSLVYETSLLLPRRSILPWRKRKLSFRSPKAKGEPLLKKDNGEEGGDDIDYDRRQLSSDEALLRSKTDEESSSANPTQSSFLEFGDDSFAIGSWEEKEVVSRDGHMKLQTSVFLASIDQRSEQAAGESACTALVAVIADWFQKNSNLMPIKSQFDSLIREGSLEWRNLCENETYMQLFPDKHFDLDTVLQAKIRSLTVVPGKSFVGFFHPEGMINEGCFEFLQGAMSFDSIWDEIDNDDSPPRVYIVSWNDHFFVLKVENEAYYIIDTLGERLYEGCDQAYILKFDDKTVIHKNVQAEESESEPVSEPEVVCRGKESCKEYIKSFLAAIPIRELQEDIKKGLASTVPVHQRLQIEFHYTEMSRDNDVVAL